MLKMVQIKKILHDDTERNKDWSNGGGCDCDAHFGLQLFERKKSF